MNLRQIFHWFRQIDAWLVVPAIAVVIFGELTHIPIAQKLEVNVWDKSLHFIAYFGLALMTTIAVRARPVTAMWFAFGLIVMGGVLEVVQGLTGRDLDPWDEVANTLGVLSGTGLAWGVISLMKARKLVEDPAAE